MQYIYLCNKLGFLDNILQDIRVRYKQKYLPIAWL